MSESEKPNIEKIRKMSYKKLSKTYNISLEEAYRLRSASNPDHFSTLTNLDLSLEEMAKKLEFSCTTIKMYRTALIKAGFEKSRRPFAEEKILSF